MLPANLMHFILVQAAAAAEAPTDYSGWVGVGIQILLALGTLVTLIWKTGASTKEVQMLLANAQPKVECIKCRAELEAKITAAENTAKNKSDLMEQRLKAIEETLAKIEKSIELLRAEVRARPIGRQTTNPRIQSPFVTEDEQG